jgi:hypothetical protein
VNATQIHVNFAKAIPRTIWYRSDILPVAVAAAFAFVSILVSYISIQPTVANINAQDTALKESHTRLTQQTTQIQAELDAVNDIQKSRDSVMQARQSGLLVAQQIVTLGNSLGKDGVASRINSKGELAGISNGFPGLTRIWNRLGPNYAVVVADPTINGNVSFTIQAVTVIPTPPPITPTANTNGAMPSVLGNPTTNGPPPGSTPNPGLPR